MTEYKVAVRLRKEDVPNLTITIRYHKTYSMVDPAMLIFDKLSIAKLEAYIPVVCPQILLEGLPLNVLLSWNGKAMMSDTITK